MMNKIEEAIIYATVMHQGKVRKLGSIPYILHPLEVAQILATMTDDQDVITAGILHDIVEDTDGTLKEIERNLPDGFFRINNQTIVNLSFVTHVEGDKTVVAGRTFSISRGRRREFLSALHLSDMMK